jgi:hypothetical protein
MSSSNVSYAGCWFIQLTDNIFFTHPYFSADGKPNIDRQARFHIAAWNLMWQMSYVLSTLFRQLVG